jgi:hypothetical protein
MKLLSTTGQRGWINKLSADASKTIIAATNASPAVANVTAHGFKTGDVVAQYAMTGTGTTLNGLFTIVEGVDADHYTLKTILSPAAVNGDGTFTGGKVQRVWAAHHPEDIGDAETTLSRFSQSVLKTGSDANRTSSASLKTVFGA